MKLLELWSTKPFARWTWRFGGSKKKEKSKDREIEDLAARFRDRDKKEK